VAKGSEIKGITKRGKMLLQFETNLEESIQSMYISGSNLMLCGNYVYNHYNDWKDTNYLLAGDKVNDVISLPVEKVKTLIPIIACADRSLKVIKDIEVLYTAELPGPPTTMQLFYNDGGESGEQVLYRKEDGKIGMMTLGKTGPDAGWVIEKDGAYM
jgi:Bardet-Biedl syndrome 7 protein